MAASRPGLSSRTLVALGQLEELNRLINEVPTMPRVTKVQARSPGKAASKRAATIRKRCSD